MRQTFGMTAKGYALWRLQRQIDRREVNQEDFINWYLIAAPRLTDVQTCRVCGQKLPMIRSIWCFGCTRGTLTEM